MGPASRQFSHHGLRRADGPQITFRIREPHNRIRVADVHPLWIVAHWVKRDPIRLFQARRKDGYLEGLAVRTATAQHADLSGPTFGYKRIAIWRHPNLPRPVEAGRIQVHLETGRRLR